MNLEGKDKFSLIGRTLLAMAIALSVQTLSAQADGGQDLPEFGYRPVSFEACMSDQRVVAISLKVGNFSPYDIDLPQGYKWSTLEHLIEIAAVIFPKDVSPFILQQSSGTLAGPDYLGDLSTTPVDYEYTDSKGQKKVAQISLFTKVIYDLKDALIAEGLYSGVSIDFSKSTAELDPAKTCERPVM